MIARSLTAPDNLADRDGTKAHGRHSVNGEDSGTYDTVPTTPNALNARGNYLKNPNKPHDTRL